MEILYLTAVLIAFLWPYWSYLGLSVAKRRSLYLKCLVCEEKIQLKQILIKSHCPCCHSSFPWQQGKEIGRVFLLTGLSFTIYTLGSQGIWLLLLSPILIGIVAADIHYRLIPNPFMWMLLGVVIIYRLIYFHSFPISSMLIAFLFCSFLLIIGRGGIGWGDLKMMWILSILVPWLLWFKFIVIINILAFLSKPIFFRNEKDLPFGVHLSIGAFFIWLEMLRKN